jgi:hypothetical protein
MYIYGIAASLHQSIALGCPMDNSLSVIKLMPPDAANMMTGSPKDVKLHPQKKIPNKTIKEPHQGVIHIGQSYSGFFSHIGQSQVTLTTHSRIIPSRVQPCIKKMKADTINIFSVIIL